MNSTDKRIEETLNRAGQTISDLPEPSECGTIYAHDVYDPNICDTVLKQAIEFQVVKPDIIGLVNEYSERWMLVDYILHLSEIIDRFEWALENVCGERDYLRRVMCGLCSNFHEDGADACETCMIGEGVPEYRSVDDEEGL